MNAQCLCWTDVGKIFLCEKTSKLKGLMVVDSRLPQWVPPTGSQLCLIGKDGFSNYYRLKTEEGAIFTLWNKGQQLGCQKFLNLTFYYVNRAASSDTCLSQTKKGDSEKSPVLGAALR